MRYQEILMYDLPISKKQIVGILLQELPILEYQLIFSSNLSIPTINRDELHYLANIVTNIGNCAIHAIRTDTEFHIATILLETDEIVGYIVLEEIHNRVFLKYAVAEPIYNNKGIVSETLNALLTINSIELVSDTQMSPSGVALWKSVAKSYDEKILYIPTKERFNCSDVGHHTTDGVKVIDPKNDNFYPDIYDDVSKTGQRFFYIISSTNKLIENSYGFSIQNHIKPNRNIPQHMPINSI